MTAVLPYKNNAKGLCMEESALRKLIEKTCDRALIVANSAAAPDSTKVEQALDDLLELAGTSPLNTIMLSTLSAALDALHERLGLPGHNHNNEVDELLFDGGYAALEPALNSLGRDRGMVLYSLPEVHRIDDALLPQLVEPGVPDLRESWTGVTIPARVSLPLTPPSRDGGVGFEWRTPRISYANSVLQIEQVSRYRDYDGSRSTQQGLCAAYRVEGHLVHVRRAMLYRHS